MLHNVQDTVHDWTSRSEAQYTQMKVIGPGTPGLGQSQGSIGRWREVCGGWLRPLPIDPSRGRGCTGSAPTGRRDKLLRGTNQALAPSPCIAARSRESSTSLFVHLGDRRSNRRADLQSKPASQPGLRGLSPGPPHGNSKYLSIEETLNSIFSEFETQSTS